MKSVRATFNVDAFYATLDAQRRSRDLTWKDVAQEAEVSASTLTRISQGRRPDVDSLAALVRWLGVPADRFLRSAAHGFGASSTLAQITSLLHQDSNLNRESAIALEELIKSAYVRLRREPASSTVSDASMPVGKPSRAKR